MTFWEPLERPWPSDVQRRVGNWCTGTPSICRASCDLWGRRRPRDSGIGRTLESSASSYYSITMPVLRLVTWRWQQQQHPCWNRSQRQLRPIFKEKKSFKILSLRMLLPVFRMSSDATGGRHLYLRCICTQLRDSYLFSDYIGIF